MLDLTANENIDDIIRDPLKYFTTDTKFTVKLIDFGESKNTGDSKQTNVLKGNLSFRPPEAKKEGTGRNAKDKIDPLKLQKGDIWMIAAHMLYLLSPKVLCPKKDSYAKLKEKELEDIINQVLPAPQD